MSNKASPPPEEDHAEEEEQQQVNEQEEPIRRKLWFFFCCPNKGRKSASACKSQNDEGPTPKLYKMRWVLLLIFTLGMFCSVLAQSTFSSVSTVIMKYYNVRNENWKVNSLSMIFLIVTIPSSWVVSFIMKRYGIRMCMIVFGALTFTGMWIRCFGYRKGEELYLWISFVGQLCIAFGQPFLSSVAGLLGVNWFGEKERTLVQVVTLLMGVVGGGVAFAIGPSLITMGSTEMDGSEYGMIIYLAVQAFLSTLCLVLIIIFVKDKPPTPPVVVVASHIEKENLKVSETEEHVEHEEVFSTLPNETSHLSSINLSSSEEQSIEDGMVNSRKEQSKDIYPEQTFWEGAKKLMTSPSFIMLTIASSCLTSVFQTLAILDQIIAPMGYSTFDGANFNMVNLICVLIGCFVLSILFDKTKKFKLISAISSFLSCIGFACFSVVMLWEKTQFTTILCFISFVFIGFFTIPTLPLISQMLVYSTYPVHPATALVISSAFGTVWSVLFLVIVNVLQSQVKDASTIILWMDLGLLIGAFLMILLFRGKFSTVLVKNQK